MSIKRFRSSTRNPPLEQILRDHARGRTIADQAYQRGSVWTVDQQRAVVRSLLDGTGIGILRFNERPEDDEFVYVVDGKQRIEALHAFATDAFAVPTHWFDVDDYPLRNVERFVQEPFRGNSEVLYSHLTDSGRQMLGNEPMVVYLTHLPDEAGEMELFDRVNFAGTIPTRTAAQNAAASA